jgi:hypothetical protein
LLVEELQMHAAMTPEDRPVYEARAFRLFELLKAIKAAAAEPLIENAEKQAAFDAESFRRRVLSIAEPDGTA